MAAAATPVFAVLAILAVVLGGAQLAALHCGKAVPWYLSAAAVSVELEGRTATRGVVGTTAARAISLVALAVIFSTTAQSATGVCPARRRRGLEAFVLHMHGVLVWVARYISGAFPHVRTVF